MRSHGRIASALLVGGTVVSGCATTTPVGSWTGALEPPRAAGKGAITTSPSAPTVPTDSAGPPALEGEGRDAPELSAVRPADVEDDAVGGEGEEPVQISTFEADAEDFDVDAWLAARGVSHWQPDRACWKRLEEPSARSEPDVNECLCRGSVTVAGQTLLWCQRPHQQPEGAEVPFVTHTVLYAVDDRGMRPVLDVPSSAAATDCKADSLATCWVSLAMATTAFALVVGDGPSGRCDAALESLDRQIRQGDTWLGELRGVYRRVCASRGRYRLRDGVLVRELEAVGVRRFAP